MPRRPKEPEVGYRLQGFEVLQFLLNDTSSIEAGATLDIGFNASMSYLVSEDLSGVGVRAQVRMFQKGSEEGPYLSEIITATSFGVVNLEKCMKDGRLLPPMKFAQSIANVAISTTRGVLFAKYAATKFGGVLMPLFNSDTLIPNEPWNVPPQQQMAIAA